VKGEPAPDRYAVYAGEVRRGLASAGLVVSPTGAMLDELNREYGPLAKTRVIPNARSADMFRNGVKEPYIFTAARLWDEAKNVAVLDRIAGELPWPVYVAGETRHPDGSDRRPVAVRALGRLSADEIAQWLSRASIYALPARYEPFGLSALEAGLSGCALVLGDISSLREVWRDTAVYVSPDDADEWRATLLSLIENRSRRDDLAWTARCRALTYSPERMAREYVSAYHLLL
jgi:glycosyltransferase involved in cell wall biosynthesis